MAYPVIDIRTARGIRDELFSQAQAGVAVDDLQAQAVSDLEGKVRDRPGADVAIDPIWAVSNEARSAWLSEHAGGAGRGQDLYQLEAKMAAVVHSCLRDLPVEVTSDPDFWRYVGLGPFRWYLMTREPELQDQDYGGTDQNRKAWLLIRTFLWGQLAYEEGATEPYRRTTVVGEASMKELGKAGMVIDFWHSHLIRRYFAVTPTVAHAFIDEATTDPVALDESTELEDRHANAFARRMTRFGRTVDLALVDDATAKSLVAEQKFRTLGKWKPATPAG